MCGIAGIVDFKSGRVRPEELAALCKAISHRGPDDHGVYINGPVGLGSQRLSVIDLSAQGHQPMCNESETVWVTFNGEIYNFQDLRTQLQTLGHQFKSKTDTETIVHAYEQWGEECVNHLSGMFAFVVWDAQKETIFVARDRLGVKPLFFVHDSKQFIFSSEVHALYHYIRPSEDDIDLVSLDYYLAFGVVPPDRCFLKTVQKLPPGHALRFSKQGLNSWRYWDVAFRPVKQVSQQDAIEQLDELLTRSVKQRLTSDVPVGCFLSGGIDSGLVTAIASTVGDGSLRTFSVGFANATPEENEQPLARLVADRYQTDHTELTVDFDGRNVLSRLLWHFGEPFADISALAVYEISKMARDHITVALAGDGGDESFAGYMNVYAAYWAERFRNGVPKPLRELARLAPVLKVQNWMRHYVNQPVLQHYNLPNHWDLHWRNSLYASPLVTDGILAGAENQIANIQQCTTGFSDAEVHLYTDLHNRLPADYLAKVDIASNMVALEVRSPFLDYELVEFAASLPIALKMSGGKQKGLLRQLASKYLPSELLRQPKRGFSPPLGKWLRGDWADLVETLVGQSLSRRSHFFSSSTIRQIVDAHLSGREDHTQRLWNLVCLEIWWQIFIDRSLFPGDEL